jgi:hypothetical protein
LKLVFVDLNKWQIYSAIRSLPTTKPLRHRNGVITLHPILKIQIAQPLLHQKGFYLGGLAVVVVGRCPQQVHRALARFISGGGPEGGEGCVTGALRGAYGAVGDVWGAGAGQLVGFLFVLLALGGGAVCHLAVFGGGIAVGNLLAVDVQGYGHFDGGVVFGQGGVGEDIAKALVLHGADHVAQVVAGVECVFVAAAGGCHQYCGLAVEVVVGIRRCVDRYVHLRGASTEHCGQ